MSVEGRLERIQAALSQRLAHVSCAVQAVHHRHNMSAILRTCDALGIHRVDLVEGHFEAVRGAARGAERWLDIHHHTSPEDAVRALADAGYAIWVADLDEASVTPEQVPLDRPVCIWMGAELEGVDPVAREAATGVVQVPMRGLAQSLNVSVAAALTLRPVAERARAERGDAALLSPAEQAAWWTSWIDREERLHEAARVQGRWRWDA